MVSRPSTLQLPDRFELDREIGRGGMAVVYRAHDKHLGRYVAIKVFSVDLSSAVGAERFRREIALTATLVHPGIVALFDSGVADGHLYYVMPFVAGETLRARLVRESRLTPQDASSLGADVAEALACAHGAGILHRDVKPENVFSVGGRAVLADFGIATALTAPTSGGEQLTADGMVLGTLAYLSPEQATGELLLDGRSDLYSLGCMLYELLCGQPPFQAATALAVLGKHLTEDPPAMSVHGIAIPPSLERLVMQLLAKRPADRPPSAADVARSLRAESLESVLTRTTTVAAVRTSEVAVVDSFAYAADDDRCADVAAAVTSAIAAALTGVEGVRVLLSGNATADLRIEGSVRRSGERVRVSIRVVDASGALRWSEQVTGSMSDVFLLEDDVSQRTATWFRNGAAAPAGDAGASRPVARLSEADALVSKAVQAFNKFGSSGGAASLGYMQEARVYLTRALELEPRNARALCAMGNLRSVEGMTRLAPRAEALASGRSMIYAALAADDRCAEVHTSMAKIALYEDNDVHLALRHARRAIELDFVDAESQRIWCIVCKIMGRLDEAIDAARAAALAAPDTAPIWNTLGDVLLAAGRNSEAIDALRRAIALLPKYVLAQERLERARRAHGETELAIELRIARLRTGNLGQRADLIEADAAAFGAADALQNDLRRELDALLDESGRRDPFADDFRRTVADRIASGHAELGEWHAAMDWVLRGYEHRPGRLRRMLTDMPVDFRGLAVDPRYTRLLRVAGLEDLI